MATVIDLRKRKEGYKGKRPFRVDYFDTFKKRKRLHFKTRKEAERFLTTIEAEMLKAKEGLLPDWFFVANTEDLTIQQIYDAYLEKKIALKEKDSAQATARSILNVAVARFTKVNASQLSPQMINDYQAEWIKSGKKKTSFYTRIRSFKTMLKWAVGNGLIARNPLEDVDVEKGKHAEKEALSEDEIRRFLLGLKDYPEYLAYFILGVNTGMRLSELHSLEWDQVDIEKRRVFIPATKSKTNENRYVPLNGECMNLINDLYITKKHAPYLLYHLRCRSNVSRRVKRLSQRFLGKPHTPHFWRVTFATRALRGKRIRGEDGKTYWAAQDVRTVAEIGGWEPNSKILLSIYQKVSEEQKRACVDLVEIGPSTVYPETPPCHQTDTEARKPLTINA